MDDQIAVRIVDGGADFLKQLEALMNGQVMVIAVFIDGFTLDVFDNEIGDSILGFPAVDELGDMRMLQIGKNLPFTAQASTQLRMHRHLLDQLDGDFLFELVGAFSQVNGAHSTMTQDAGDSVG